MTANKKQARHSSNFFKGFTRHKRKSHPGSENRFRFFEKNSAGHKESEHLKLARQFIPGGVNSPVRAFRAVGGHPLLIRKGKGPFVWDEGNKQYVDYCCSWGALLLGHAPIGLIETLQRELADGTSFGTLTVKEAKLACQIHRFFPSMEKVRLVSSGTESVMSVIRLARGFTGKKKILKIDGGYHGHVDSLLVKAGSGIATLGLPDSAGVPPELAHLTISVPFNDFEALERVFRKEGHHLAAFILEPVPANMGVVPPGPGYLEFVRSLTRRYRTLLIFDEIITGFRLSEGGVQKTSGVTPDLTCLGKVLGCGLPLAAFGGRSEIMDHLAPDGPVYQAGTLSGNPIAVSASLWMLDQIEKKKQFLYSQLEEQSKWFYQELQKLVGRWKQSVHLNTAGSMFTLFFAPKEVTHFQAAKLSNTRRFSKFFHSCLREGIYLSPSQFEANFISTAHDKRILDRTLSVFKKALRKV